MVPSRWGHVRASPRPARATPPLTALHRSTNAMTRTRPNNKAAAVSSCSVAGGKPPQRTLAPSHPSSSFCLQQPAFQRARSPPASSGPHFLGTLGGGWRAGRTVFFFSAACITYPLHFTDRNQRKVRSAGARCGGEAAGLEDFRMLGVMEGEEGWGGERGGSG